MQLLQVIWSGARGKERVIPTRSSDGCKPRIRQISNHLSKSVISLHESWPKLVEPVSTVLNDAAWHDKVSTKRAELRADDAKETPILASDSVSTDDAQLDSHSKLAARLLDDCAMLVQQPEAKVGDALQSCAHIRQALSEADPPSSPAISEMCEHIASCTKRCAPKRPMFNTAVRMGVAAWLLPRRAGQG